MRARLECSKYTPGTNSAWKSSAFRNIGLKEVRFLAFKKDKREIHSKEKFTVHILKSKNDKLHKKKPIWENMLSYHNVAERTA